MLSKIATATAMGVFLGRKTNLPRELDVNLLPLMGGLSESRVPIYLARQEIFTLKVAAGRAAIRATFRKPAKRDRVLNGYHRAVGKLYRTLFGLDPQDLENNVRAYEAAGQDPSITAADVYFHRTGLGVTETRAAFIIALHRMKQAAMTRYLSLKWII